MIVRVRKWSLSLLIYNWPEDGRSLFEPRPTYTPSVAASVF